MRPIPRSLRYRIRQETHAVVVPPPPPAQRFVQVPDGFKVKSTEKNSAALLVRLKREAGEEVDPRLEVIANAPVIRRKLTPEEQVDEVRNALSTVRASLADCPDPAAKAGMFAVVEVVQSALNGELS